MKKAYSAPQMNIARFEVNEYLTASGGGGSNGKCFIGCCPPSQLIKSWH